MNNPGFFMNLLRNFFTVLDSAGYNILTFVYKIFYTVSSANIISGELIRNFYSRLQLILGIIMIFKLSMSILNIIINPDSIKDQKQGAGKIITRVAVSLFMLTLIIPINISVNSTDKNSLNAYVNDHGVLFGFLYKFQQSMLQENIIGKLILGTSSTVEIAGNGDINNLSDVGGTMALSVARSVVRPNVKDESKPYCLSEGDEGYDPANPCQNVTCPTEVYQAGYTDDSITADNLLDFINSKCSGSYAFNYTPLIGLVCSIIMAVIILGFTIDIAVRAIKLAILRLVAPIPIISYIDPKSAKDGAFGNWTKALISTYIDLFIRLAIVYFGAFIIQSLFVGNGIEFPDSGSVVVNGFATVAIIIGVLIFMKQAPKFLKDMLGIKGAPMGNAGLAGVLGGAAMAIGGGGLAGFGLGAMQGLTTSADAQAQGKAMSPFSAWSQNRDQMAKIRTGDKDARGGIMGRTMDRALYNARERQLAIRGLTVENVEAAKAAMYKQQDQVRAAQTLRDLAYEKLKVAGISGDPSQMAALDERNFATHADYTAAVRQRAEQQALWNDFTTKEQRLAAEQQKYGKIEKNYKNGSGARTAMGVDPRQYDEYTPGYQVSIMGHQIYDYRAGVYRAGANRARFSASAAGEPSNIDDQGILGGHPETGASPNTR